MSQWAYATVVGLSSRANTDGSFKRLESCLGRDAAQAQPHFTTGTLSAAPRASSGRDVVEGDRDLHGAADVDRGRLPEQVAGERWRDLDAEMAGEHHRLEPSGVVGIGRGGDSQVVGEVDRGPSDG